MKIDDKILEKAYSLNGGDWILRLGRKKVEAAYNGIGPEWMPEKIRGAITKILNLFQPAAIIHDCRFEYNKDRSDDAFNKANEEFRDNCYMLILKEYWFLNPIRFWRMRQADIAYEALKNHGKKAWDEGGKSCK